MTMTRRDFLPLAGAGLLTFPSAVPSAADRAPRSVSELKPLFTQTICRWSAENPRHDHQLIFPLKGGRLLFVWCEYYANRPSLLKRKPTTRNGQARDDMPCRISAKISTDKGRTWGARFILQDNLWKRNVKHPNLVRLQSGEILFSFVGWDSAAQRNVFMKRSQDEGESWSDPVRISEPGWYCNNNDHVVTLKSGRILLPAHGVVGGGPYRGGRSKLESFVYFSDDGFKTWKRSAGSMRAPGRGCHEPSIVELKDGRLLCLLRTTLGRVYQSYSRDRGDHWSKPEATGLRAPDSPPLVKRIPRSGRLLVLWNHVESRSNWPRTPLTSAISDDEGRTWHSFRDIDARPKRDAAYASISFQDDEALVAYYTRPTSWARDSEILLKGFRLSQFDRPR